MGLYLWTGAATFEDFTITGNVLKNLKQKGLAIGSGSGRFVNLQICNNVLYGMNPNISDFRAQQIINTVFSGSYRMSGWETYRGDTGWDTTAQPHKTRCSQTRPVTTSPCTQPALLLMPARTWPNRTTAVCRISVCNSKSMHFSSGQTSLARPAAFCPGRVC
ncbi:hypothetical protein SAMN02745124_01817 [Desulfofustis glycolicus DSM 9705]|uniref:Right handed beta helix region n=1 Tax=Desulfofustis glycolicus DSM 9705 TaxID=1121409 RepID=A0A1M5VQG3_9BACT|nr:hypothetical protein SAMN02745124_01817 [Desulfofustis glycolicus DSM 9705]